MVGRAFFSALSYQPRLTCKRAIFTKQRVHWSGCRVDVLMQDRYRHGALLVVSSHGTIAMGTSQGLFPSEKSLLTVLREAGLSSRCLPVGSQGLR